MVAPYPKKSSAGDLRVYRQILWPEIAISKTSISQIIATTGTIQTSKPGFRNGGDSRLFAR